MKTPIDHRSAAAKARDEWLASAEGVAALNASILRSEADTRFLKNRLELAFSAGIKCGEAQSRIPKDAIRFVYDNTRASDEWPYEVSIKGIDLSGSGDTTEDAWETLVSILRDHFKAAKAVQKAVLDTIGIG